MGVVGVEMPGKGALADVAWPADRCADEAALAAEGAMMARLAEYKV